jgi:excisionase family DNA binding protein
VKNSLDVKEAAAYIGISPATLRLWRTQGRGPHYFKAGRLIRYRVVDLDAWIAKQLREPWQSSTEATSAPTPVAS